jgi:hypothetical protein
MIILHQRTSSYPSMLPWLYDHVRQMLVQRGDAWREAKVARMLVPSLVLRQTAQSQFAVSRLRALALFGLA